MTARTPRSPHSMPRRASVSRACCGTGRAPGRRDSGSSGAPPAPSRSARSRGRRGIPTGGAAGRAGASRGGASASAPRSSGGRSSIWIVWPAQSATAYSSAFSSSRTFPGHGQVSSTLERVGREAQRPARAAADVREEVLGDEGDVLRPLAQRRKVDRDDAQAVVEVLPEAPRPDRLQQVLVRRGDDPRVRSLRGALSPTRSNCRSCRTRRSLTCRCERHRRRSRRGRSCRRAPARAVRRGPSPRP